MYAGGNDTFGSPWVQLHHLDRLLAQLTKPAVPGTGLPPSVREQLHALGLPTRGTVRREELIEHVWGRKRPLLRQLESDDDPIPPCA
jgi:hypothetical protein